MLWWPSNMAGRDGSWLRSFCSLRLAPVHGYRQLLTPASEQFFLFHYSSWTVSEKGVGEHAPLGAKIFLLPALGPGADAGSFSGGWCLFRQTVILPTASSAFCTNSRTDNSFQDTLLFLQTYTQVFWSLSDFHEGTIPLGSFKPICAPEKVHHLSP